LPNVVVIALDSAGYTTRICDELLREYPGVRVIAVAPDKKLHHVTTGLAGDLFDNIGGI